MASTFNARDAKAYDRLMGRWSQRLALKFLAFATPLADEHVFEMGCGTGSLTFAIPEMVAAVTAIDFSPLYLEAARARNMSPKITIEQGDGTALRFSDNSFDRALTLLVLQHVSSPEIAVSELVRVTKPGGTVAAAVWDTYGGMGAQRMLWDIASVLDPEAAKRRAKAMTRPAAQPGALARMFEVAGLLNIETAELLVRMDFADFADWWEPVAAGEGSLGDYVSALDDTARVTLKAATREGYLAGGNDGPRSFVAVARAVKGVVGSI